MPEDYAPTERIRPAIRRAYYFGEDTAEPHGGMVSFFGRNEEEEAMIHALDGLRAPQYIEREPDHALVFKNKSTTTPKRKPVKRPRLKPSLPSLRFDPMFPRRFPIILTVPEFFNLGKLYAEGELIPAHEIPFLRQNTWVKDP